MENQTLGGIYDPIASSKTERVSKIDSNISACLLFTETCDSEPTWDCYVSFPESAYSLDKAKVNCEQSPTDSNCVLKGKERKD